MLELEYHPDIYEELNEAYSWYENRLKGLGEDFIEELDHAFSLIKTMPKTWPILTGKFRRFLLKRFPYGIIYQIRKNDILILVIMHLSRKPGYWMKRAYN